MVTTQELTPESIDKGFTLDPALTTKTEATDNGFILRGDFTETDTYVLKLTTNLKGVLGPQLEEEVSRDVFFGKMPAGISFVNKKALYLTSKGARNMGVQIVNVPKVQVKIAKIYENNILSYVRNSRYEDYGYVGEEWQPTGTFNYSTDDQSFYSDLVVNKTVDTDDLPRLKGRIGPEYRHSRQQRPQGRIPGIGILQRRSLPRLGQAGIRLGYWAHCQAGRR